MIAQLRLPEPNIFSSLQTSIILVRAQKSSTALHRFSPKQLLGNRTKPLKLLIFNNKKL